MYKDGEDVVVRNAEDIISAGRILDDSKERVDQVTDLVAFVETRLNNLEGWEECYLQWSSSHVQFFAVQNDVGFNSKLLNALSSLEVEIANDERFSMITFEAVALPNCDQLDLKQFIAPQAKNA